MRKLALALTLSALCCSTGCATHHVLAALNPPAPNGTATVRRPLRPTALDSALRLPDGSYHLVIAYENGDARHFRFNPAHPSLTKGEHERWPSAHRVDGQLVPTLAPTLPESPEGVAVAIEASESTAGPALRMRDGVIALREETTFEPLCRVPGDRTALTRRSPVYRRGASPSLNKVIAVSAAAFVDALLFPFSAAAYLATVN